MRLWHQICCLAAAYSVLHPLNTLQLQLAQQPAATVCNCSSSWQLLAPLTRPVLRQARHADDSKAGLPHHIMWCFIIKQLTAPVQTAALQTVPAVPPTHGINNSNGCICLPSLQSMQPSSTCKAPDGSTQHCGHTQTRTCDQAWPVLRQARHTDDSKARRPASPQQQR